MSRWDNYTSDRKSELNKYANDYVKRNYDRIHFNTPSGTRQRWLDEARKLGFDSLAPFIRACVEYCILNINNYDELSDNSIDSDTEQ